MEPRGEVLGRIVSFNPFSARQGRRTTRLLVVVVTDDALSPKPLLLPRLAYFRHVLGDDCSVRNSCIVEIMQDSPLRFKGSPNSQYYPFGSLLELLLCNVNQA